MNIGFEVQRNYLTRKFRRMFDIIVSVKGQRRAEGHSYRQKAILIDKRPFL